MVSVANAGLVLTVNGLDTSMPIEVKSDDDIIIAVTGQTDEQKESYSVTCEMGGKLEPLPEPNTLQKIQKKVTICLPLKMKNWVWRSYIRQ